MNGLRQHAAGPLNETCDIYQQIISISGLPFWQLLQSIRVNAASLGVTISLTDSDPSDEHELLEDKIEDFANRTFSIRIVKVPTAGVLKFFTVDGFEHALISEPERFEQVNCVLLAEAEFECASANLIVKPWPDEYVAQPRTVDDPISPRRLVNDISGKGLTPISVGTWITEESGSPWLKEKLLNAASHRLALCIPDAVSIDVDGNVVAHLRSGRKVAARVDPASRWSDQGLMSLLSEVCRWIYLDGRDAETRHSLLSAELVRLWPTGAGWQEGLWHSLAGGLEAARTAYRLHVQSKGVDALKLMSDLRKGLSDDVRALSNNTSSLSASLWRDAAVAFGVVVVRLANATVGNWLLWMAAAYLAASCFFTCVAASSAVRGIEENEKSFRSRLYGPLLLDEEYEELAAKHYRTALSSFRWYRFFIVVAYLIAVGALIWIAYAGTRSVESFSI
ncbi:hypothetical protein [Bradyrhizobium australiense]|uniref:Uncharacterized protein n=1 Tax=Bradyrhizobium australiense TaxID=2721161 RepID=A0A7Y4LWL1_9BRAD|nr:hypothetical protein [Bradyrhizobium australiense]NOJ41567.1 hypothetical protein [Bradyrhizobium australiense]